MNMNSHKYLFNSKLKHPIERHPQYLDEYNCICRGCRTKYDHLHCYVWNICKVCKKKIWYNCAKCTLYSWRGAEKLICFNCRLPYYEKNMTMADIIDIVFKKEKTERLKNRILF